MKTNSAFEKLCSVALKLSRDADKYWEVVAQLHKRATVEDLTVVLDLCSSKETSHRILGANLLAQFGVPKRICVERCRAKLVEIVHNEKSLSVLEAAIYGLGHQQIPKRCSCQLLQISDSINKDIREAISYAISLESDRYIDQITLRYLSDPVRNVREWATFSTANGSIRRLRTRRFHDALVTRLNDRFFSIRAEAVIGLSRLRDARALATIIHLLKNDFIDRQFLQALLAYNNPILLSELVYHRRRITASRHQIGRAYISELDAAILLLQEKS